jgi:hypothetical protein
VNLYNLNVDSTLTDEVASKLFEARCIDNNIPPIENQRESFLGYCRQKCIDGRLLFADMALGYKCAELICSLLLDKAFYISHLDLKKNPIGDDGVIVLMHAIKRSTTLVYLDLSSVNMTSVGAQRVIRSMRHNESIQHLVISNSEG